MSPADADAKARAKAIVGWHRKGECVCEKNACLDDIADAIAAALLAAAAEEREHEWICDRCGIRVEPHRCQNEATF